MIDNNTKVDKQNDSLQLMAKKAYISPQFESLGSLVKVTLGGSNLDADSGQGPGSGPNVG